MGCQSSRASQLSQLHRDLRIAEMTAVSLLRIVCAGLGLAALASCGQAGPGPSETQAAPDRRTPVDYAFITLEPLGADDAVAASVGETQIYMSDVRREAVSQNLVEDGAALRPADPVFQQVLSELIEQRLLALEARRQGLDADAETRRRLAAAEERILGNVLVETAVSRSVSDEAVQRVYEEQVRLVPPTEEVRARHILVSTREEADEVARLLAEGEDFATLAAQVSQDPATRFEGGDLGYFTREGILPGFAGVAFETPVGSISAPFQTEFGWHVLTVVDRRNQARPSLDEMRPRIVRFLTLDGIQTLLDTIRETYPVTRSAAPAPAELRAQETEETGRGAENDTDSSGGER